MEKASGLRLFDKRGGRLVPTSEALKLLPYAKRVVNQLNAAQRVARGLRDGAFGHVTIAASSPSLQYLVPTAIRHFQLERPGVTVEVLPETTSNGVAAIVTNKDADFGVSHAPLHHLETRFMQTCAAEIISEQEIAVAVRSDHRLASLSAIRPRDLRDEVIIAVPDHFPSMALIRVAFLEANIKLNVPVVAGSSFAVCGLVHAGVGVGLCNGLQLTGGIFEDVVARPFRPRIPISTIIYSPIFEELSLNGQHLIKIIKRVASKTPKAVAMTDTSIGKKAIRQR